MQPNIKASKFFQQSEADRELIRELGLLPVNDLMFPLWEDEFNIALIFGGRGGGKSEAVVQKLVEDCIKENYFKCYYGRKVFDTVRHSCFETIIHHITERGKTAEFHYSDAENSSMVITHKKTGNQFIPFGSDKAEKLKSIKDPTVIWGEEFDQFALTDFMEILPTLRTTRGKNRFIATFNTHKVFSDHWLLKYFFPDLYTGEDKPEFDILTGMNVLKIFVNYTDNYFIDHQAYYNILKLASGGSVTVLEAIANGAWGVVQNDRPWLYAFDPVKHVKPHLPLLHSQPIYLAWDFNCDPLTCTAWQFSPVMGMPSSFIHCINEFGGNLQIRDLCQQIKTTYPGSLFFVTGDSSGNQHNPAYESRHDTAYSLIASYLGISKKQLNANMSNLTYENSRLLMNAMFQNYPNLYIDGTKCPRFVRDCGLATPDPKEKKDVNKLLKDRGIYKMDFFDGGRYLFQRYFQKFAHKMYFSLFNQRA